METCYGRHADDGTMEYHDSKESLLRATQLETSSSNAALFGIIGFITGGVAVYVLMLKTGLMDWPKCIQFIAGSRAGAGAGAYVLAKLADMIMKAIVILIAITIVLGIGHAVWQAL
jgi:uncharacterized membrane protein YfcA